MVLPLRYGDAAVIAVSPTGAGVSVYRVTARHAISHECAPAWGWELLRRALMTTMGRSLGGS